MQEVPIQEVTPAATLIQDVTDTASQVASNTDAGIFEMITHSGSTVFVVLMILILCSLFTWAIVFAKIMQYKRVNKECKEFRDIFWKNRNFARIEEATEHLSNNPYVKITGQEAAFIQDKIKKQRKWGFTVGVGYGINYHGQCYPYLGVMFGYRLF